MTALFPMFITLCALNETNILTSALNDEHGETFYVFEADLTRFLANTLKFSFDIKTPSDGQVGKRLANGTWTGLIGMLQRKECDISIEAIAITEERKEVVSFTFPFYITDAAFMTNKPEIVSKGFAILHPFSIKIWSAIVGIFLFVSLYLYAMFGNKLSYWRILFMMFSILSEKSFKFIPNSISGRLLLLTWIVGSMFLTFSYKAVLLSFLTFPPTEGISTIGELSKAVSKGTHICVTYDGTYYLEALKKLDDESIKVIVTSLEKYTQNISTPHDFLDSPVGRKGAMIDLRRDILPFQYMYSVSKDSFFLSILGIATQKDFYCIPALNRIINLVYQSGIYEKILRDRALAISIKLHSTEVKESNKRNNRIALDDITGAFILLLIGHAIGIFTLCIEVIWHKIFH